jgi:hypothetical protein
MRRQRKRKWIHHRVHDNQSLTADHQSSGGTWGEIGISSTVGFAF